MDRLRRTFSLRRPKKKAEPSESSKPQEWLDDESKIKEGCCSFQVKYLGNIEVYESRGMQICEEAIKALRKSKKKTQKAILYVSGDALRVSDDVSQHLIVDQTIEKVSFCAPDHSHEKGFTYICRDGATRRWMCYAFMAIKDSQLPSITQRLIDPQCALVPKAPPNPPVSSPNVSSVGAVGNTVNGFSAPSTHNSSVGTIARPRPSASVFERQASLRMFPKLQDASPFKRELSLRLETLPSSLQRRTGVASGDNVIPEESSKEVEEQEPTLLLPTTSTSSASVPRPFASEQVALTTTTPVGNHSTSLESELSALTFPDPFSSAPVNPATIQQHLQQQQLMNRQFAWPDRNHLTGLSFSTTIGTVTPNSNALMSVEGQPLPQQQYSGAHSFFPPPPPTCLLGGPPAASPGPTAPLPSCSPILPGSTVPINGYSDLSFSLATGNASHQGGYSGPVTSSLAIPATRTVVSGQPTWSSTSTPDPNSSPWRSAVPLLLPPEPDRYSDPFDLGWAERATAVLNQSMRKPGNPFADSHGPFARLTANPLPFATGEDAQTSVSVPAGGHPAYWLH